MLHGIGEYLPVVVLKHRTNKPKYNKIAIYLFKQFGDCTHVAMISLSADELINIRRAKSSPPHGEEHSPKSSTRAAPRLAGDCTAGPEAFTTLTGSASC